MTTHGELTIQKPAEVSRQQEIPAQPMDLMAAAIQAATNPAMNVENVERLLALAGKLEEDKRRVSFQQALERVQAACPRINKSGRIFYEGRNGKPGQNTPYALLEDIDRAIRPLMASEGFSVRWNAPTSNGKIRIVGTLSHRDGHSETQEIELPADTSGSKNPVQAVGSTVSYGRRHLLKMFFNLIEVGEDDDGSQGQADPPITEDQARTVADRLAETGASVERFKAHFKVEKLADLRVSQLTAVHAALDAKGRKSSL